MNIPRHILPVIVIAQFCCTSLWFAGNGVMADLVENFSLPSTSLGHLTSSVQFGFITGTLAFAFFTIADRYSPSRVFFISALFGALFNMGMIWQGNTIVSLFIFRFLTGFFLAGIYPVGMKIAADYFDKGLGKSLGYLVGALVLGTALPHLLRGSMETLPWVTTIWMTSLLAVLGGTAMIIFVEDGPFRKAGRGLDLTAFFKVFDNRKFRAAAFGYFGHMWELYTFWAFAPVMLASFLAGKQIMSINISVWSFFIISIGGLACVIGGYLSLKYGARRIAFISLLMSCLCCIFCPIILSQSSPSLLILFLLVWGMVVIADSPLFSTLVAQNANASVKGTALTIVNCIGFAITIVSIQVMTYFHQVTDSDYVYMILAIGPVFGLVSLSIKIKD